MMSSEIVKWGDDAQYVAAPMRAVRPEATLLWATPDPLGAIAAVARMYKGEPTYDLADISGEERRHYWEESFKSHLRAPHEFVQFHFFVEGVTRAHTHQMVRQRTATFAQESLRFAVKENLASETPMPPSIVGNEMGEQFWNQAVAEIDRSYNALVNAGIPAEDARGLLPHAVTTRLHWRTNLNDLLHHAGNRLCTQAQFEWRFLMLSVMKAIREYDGVGTEDPSDRQAWQFQLIGKPNPKTFAPICYHTGKCEFRADFDRPCTIRDRVDANAKAGVPSDQWGQDHVVDYQGPVVAGTFGERITGGHMIPAIQPEEWLLDPGAAR
jgi:flavin-dependent thymidylate synthase